MSICLVCFFCRGYIAKESRPSLSQKISTRSTMLITPRLMMNFLNRTTSFTTSLAIIYSDYVVESVMVSCLELLQVIAPPFIKNTNLDCDRELSLSFWKIASILPFIFSYSLSPKTKNVSLVLLRYFKMFFIAIYDFRLGWCDNEFSCSKHTIHYT